MRAVNAATMPDELTRWTTQALKADLGTESFDTQALTVEASFRRFYRVVSRGAGQPSSRVVMSSPPDKESNERFCALAGVFSAAGVPVPEVIDRDEEAGFYLLTDLGPRDLEHAYAEGQAEAAVTAAINQLLRLQTVQDPQVAPYAVQRFEDELGIFTEWFLGHMLGKSLPAELEPTFAALVERTQLQPQCCVHRDYHCRNLLFDRSGSFGIVDFQDALVGPFAYDLASLIRDCYHEFPESDVRRFSTLYLAERERRTGDAYDPSTFAADLDFCAVQRQLKAIGIFARLKLRDGKPTHLRYISPLLERLARLCRTYPGLATLGAYLATLPPQARAWQT